MRDRNNKMVVVPVVAELIRFPLVQLSMAAAYLNDPLGSWQTTDERRMKKNLPVMKHSNETGSRNEAPVTMLETDTNKDEQQQQQVPAEVGGPRGLEPTRYGDWEKGGRCIDF